MFKMFRDRSIRSKLTLMTMLTTSLALVVACAGFAIFDYFNYRQELVDQLNMHAAVVGGNSTAALAFANATDASQTLETLNAENNIEAAAIYGEEGNLFAKYTMPAFKDFVFPAQAESNTHYFGSGSLEVFKDIVVDGKKIGTVYVRSNLERIRARTQKYAGISVLVVIVCGLGAFVLAKRLQRFVSDPIQHLYGTAKTISVEKNYSLRAVKQCDDELGILIDCFNEMLSQIQERDRNLEKARTDAEQANSAKSDFLAKMSHEIRTPLNGVIGTVQLLLDTGLSAQQRRLAHLARASGDALLTLINDILDFTKIEAGKMELEHIEFNPQDIAEEAMDILGSKAANKGLELACHTDDKASQGVQGDPDRLRQILTNLINNAIKFTEKGSVVVRLRMEKETKTHCVLKFQVTDTGPGIPAARLHRQFQRFSQVDASTTRKHGGTGLGLAISKQLVEMMGGEIGVESEVGKGATFWFTVAAGEVQRGEVEDVEAGVDGKHADPGGDGERDALGGSAGATDDVGFLGVDADEGDGGGGDAAAEREGELADLAGHFRFAPAGCCSFGAGAAIAADAGDIEDGGDAADVAGGGRGRGDAGGRGDCRLHSEAGAPVSIVRHDHCGDGRERGGAGESAGAERQNI